MRIVSATPTLAFNPNRPLATGVTAGARVTPVTQTAGDRLLSSAQTTLSSFSYASLPLQDVHAAQRWNPALSSISGAEANKVVTTTYNRLDKNFTNYLGQPEICNWLSYGKYASAYAGLTIKETEDLLSAARFQPSGVIGLLKDGANISSMKQGAEFLDILHDAFQQSLHTGWNRLNPFAQLGFAGYAKKQIEALHSAFVMGNTAVYADVAPAFDTFMTAESQGKSGVDTLKKAGYGTAPRDPQGLILQSFVLYTQAHDLGLKAQTAPSAQRSALLAQRTALVNRANLMLVTHEQWVVVQRPDVFGDPKVSSLINSLGGLLAIKDATGTHTLLPNGGNWSDFATRMGFAEVPLAQKTPGAYVLEDSQHVMHAFVPAPAAKRQGTIYQYFLDNLTPDISRRMIAGNPAGVAAPAGLDALAA